MRLAVLRPVDKMEESLKIASDLGFDTVAASPLVIVPNDTPDIGRLFDELKRGSMAYVVLTSSTSVNAILELARMHDVDVVPLIDRCVTVAIGPATAAAMREEGMRVDLTPEEYTSEGVVTMLTSRGVEGKGICLLRSDKGERILVTGLQDAGASVTEVHVYRLEPQPEGEELKNVVQKALAGEIDAFVFSSAMTAATFIDAAERMGAGDEIIEMLNNRAVVAMGPPTKRKLEAMGVSVTVMPQHATFESMLAALMKKTDG